jgi:hypothetical protein
MPTETKLSPARTRELIELLRALTASAQSVVDHWSEGDLATAVNMMEGDCSDAAEFLKWLDGGE